MRKDMRQVNFELSDIKLYFFCKNGKRWYFEAGQRICNIIQEQYWSIEKTFIPYKPNDPIGMEMNVFGNSI